MSRGLSGRKGLTTGGVVVLILAALAGWLNGGLGEGAGEGAGGGAGGGAQTPRPAGANGAEAPFDYYVLALSWSPSYCADRPDADQCGQGRRFILHGLWPQFERGYPQDCPSDAADPSNRLLSRYEDLSGSRGLLAHQWRKHGRCAGVSAESYLEASRRAVEAVAIPPSLEAVARDLTIDAGVVEAAFVEANPGMARDGVTVKCRDGRLSEVRICLTRDLALRTCGPDVIRDCRQSGLDLPAPK